MMPIKDACWKVRFIPTKHLKRIQTSLAILNNNHSTPHSSSSCRLQCLQQPPITRTSKNHQTSHRSTPLELFPKQKIVTRRVNKIKKTSFIACLRKKNTLKKQLFFLCLQTHSSSITGPSSSSTSPSDVTCMKKKKKKTHITAP